VSRFKRRVESLERSSVTSINADELDLQAYRKRLAFEFDLALAKLIQTEHGDEYWAWLCDAAERGGMPVPLAELDPVKFPGLIALHARIAAEFEPRWK